MHSRTRRWTANRNACGHGSNAYKDTQRYRYIQGSSGGGSTSQTGSVLAKAFGCSAKPCSTMLMGTHLGNLTAQQEAIIQSIELFTLWKLIRSANLQPSHSADVHLSQAMQARRPARLEQVNPRVALTDTLWGRR